MRQTRRTWLAHASETRGRDSVFPHSRYQPRRLFATIPRKIKVWPVEFASWAGVAGAWAGSGGGAGRRLRNTIWPFGTGPSGGAETKASPRGPALGQNLAP